MAQLAGTTDTYDLKGQREDLMNRIFMITPEDTPAAPRFVMNGRRTFWQRRILPMPRSKVTNTSMRIGRRPSGWAI
jgi:hypothetical protein